MTFPEETTLQQEFLQEISRKFEFTGDTYQVFIVRFDPNNDTIDDDQQLANQINFRSEDINKIQKIKDELKNNIYPILRKNECVIESKPGRPEKGNEPWKQAYKWLWKNKYPEWLAQQQTQNNQPEPQPETLQINWREICQKMLQSQQEQQRLRRQITELKHEIEIFVELGLVQPKPARRKEEIPFPDAAEGMRQYELKSEEITKQYEYQQFIDEVIGQQTKNLAIIGEPGAGKTTWLSKIAEYLANNPDYPSPICINLSRLENRTLEDYLLHIWLQEALKFIPSQVTVTQTLEENFKQQFKDKRVWLLLDGVDEMKTTENSPLSQLNSQLEGWVTWTRVILTCRLNVWQPNPIANFEYYRTLPFSDAELGNFIQQWYEKEKKPELGEQLQQKLTAPQHSRIFNLVKNPLRLAMLCQIWCFLPGELPETKANLYQRFVNETYEWKKGEFGTTATQIQQLNQALGKLALKMIDEQISLKESVIKNVMSLKKFTLAKKLGWLNEIYRDQKTNESVYAFFHLTFAEYFAACVIDDWDYFLPKNHVNKPVEGKKYRIFENEWNEIFLLWMGRTNIDDKKEEFIKKLVNFKDGVNNFYSNLAYVQSGIALVEFKSCSLADTIIEQLIKWGFGYFDSKEKVWLNFIDPIPEDARKILLLTDKERVIPALISLFHNIQSEDTRRKADLISLLHDIQSEDTHRKVAKSLGKIEAWDEQTIGALIPFLNNIQDEFTRWSVADKLGKIDVGNEQAISALIPFLKDTRNEDIRWRVAEILGNIAVGNEQAIAALISLLKDSKFEPTRWIVADSLGKIAVGNEQVIAAFICLLHNTQDRDIRWSAAYILGKILKTENNYLMTVSALNKHLTNEVETNFDLYEKCFKILWQCTKHLTYPQFYKTWHATDTTTLNQLEQQYTDIYTQLKQLQPTSTTYPIPLNAANLEGKTAEKAIAKGILIKIYGEIFPKQKANSIEDIFDLENELQPLREHLKTDKIALIFCNINPHPELINFCQQLQNNWLKIALITDTPIASPLSGFPPQQDNLLGVLQTWLQELG
ncbi:HEAT repeat domain-containing protein [Anabaena sphaerica FACHB-251]|uniref:HEAT repeat domain-containing protein n=1 Tax=Anabaena sphaerica FACHB-251 TaxID=2692883 RepID=A0A926WJ62_9NOST|nr:HEAT repeat domain-containing protein [Anabaena sphaerica]MBD2295067.1 HEAT repeat domain-containing protein [Anabaena sphaerica FACHB-251]